MTCTFRALTLAAAICLPALAAGASEFSVIRSNSTEFESSIVAVDGAMYVSALGPPPTDPSECQCGVISKITTDGQETVLHDFTGGVDGHSPFTLIRSLNRLVGIAHKTRGGSTIVTGYDLQGNETIYYANRLGSRDPKLSFGISQDNGRIIVQSDDGGLCPQGITGGTLFTIRKDASSVHKLLHSFCGPADGGTVPYNGVVDVNGTLYGYVSHLYGNPYASVYSLTPSGILTILHTFTKDSAGGTILGNSPLSFFNGRLFGTYFVFNNGQRYSTPFAMDLSGNVETLGHLPEGREGEGNGGLVQLGPKLYGLDDNVLFSIAADGRVAIEHVFDLGGPAGFSTEYIPVVIGGALYGTTFRGGAHKQGAIFKFVP